MEGQRCQSKQEKDDDMAEVSSSQEVGTGSHLGEGELATGAVF